MSEPSRLNLKQTLDNLPPIQSDNVQSSVQALLKDKNVRVPILVALDDDPTGTQFRLRLRQSSYDRPDVEAPQARKHATTSMSSQSGMCLP